MKRLVSLVAAIVLSTGLVAPVTVTAAHAATTASVSAVAESASPVPGRFCKRSDRGKKVKTARYGLVVCRADKGNDRYSRWYHA